MFQALKHRMRFIYLDSLKEGMILGKTIFGDNGVVLIPAGATIKTAYIKKIKTLNYNGLYISDEETEGIEVVDVVSAETKNEVVYTLKGAFNRLKKGLIDTAKTMKHIDSLIDEVIEQILSDKDTVINMMDLKKYDDYTFFHCTNVAVLSTIIGIELSLPKKDLYELCLAGLLHDIGKIYIDENILNKKSSLTKEEMDKIKEHPELGYRLLKEKFSVPTKTFVAVLQHHEKFDGSGYPRGLKSEEISLFGKILCIADIYDALISDRPYRKGLPPSEAMEYIMAGGDYYYDSDLVKIFYNKIAPYPIGVTVVLSDGRLGVVEKNTEGYCMRPQVKIIMEGGSKVTPYSLNLNNLDTQSITVIGLYKEENEDKDKESA